LLNSVYFLNKKSQNPTSWLFNLAICSGFKEISDDDDDDDDIFVVVKVVLVDNKEEITGKSFAHI
jgi:hypothetical protein